MLLNSNELIRYDVEVADGMAGVVRDLLLDSQSWAVHHIVIDTDGFLRNHEVVIGTSDIRELKLPEETVVLGLTAKEVVAAKTIDVDVHQFSAMELRGYKVRTEDGEAGEVRGLLVETSTWTIRYFVVATGRWLSERTILLAPQAVKSIDRNGKFVSFDVSRESIEGSPEYDANLELRRDVEAFLHDHYSWPPYWDAS